MTVLNGVLEVMRLERGLSPFAMALACQILTYPPDPGKPVEKWRDPLFFGKINEDV